MLAIGGLLMWAGISGHENTGALILVSLFAFFLGGLLTYAGVTGNAHKME